ncbi:hypothetical protein AURDEDRAFT_112831 [Auricularia subglabra TFB-10046 SS5]|nr:hypothetical protein AURDEDRAFT_112831 [Auricularia subglabra TFB-10046 SS5]
MRPARRAKSLSRSRPQVDRFSGLGDLYLNRASSKAICNDIGNLQLAYGRAQLVAGSRKQPKAADSRRR